MPSLSYFFFIPTVAASNFPALILEYFFSPDILVHIFLVPVTLFPGPSIFSDPFYYESWTLVTSVITHILISLVNGQSPCFL